MRLTKRLGLGTIFTVLAVTVFLFTGGKALAAGPNLNLEFGDTKGDTITGKYNNQKFTFEVNNSYSNGVSTIYQISSSNLGPICSGSLIQIPTDIANHPTATTAVQPGGRIGDLKYKPAGSNSCTVYPDLQIPVSAYGAPTSGTGSTSSAKTEIDWSDAKGKLNSDGSQLVVTFTDKTTITLKDKNSGDSTINFKPTSDSVGLIDGVKVDSWCSDNTAYGAGDKSYGITLSSYSASSGSVKVCYNNGSPTPVTQPSSGTISIPIDTSAYVDPNTATAQTSGQGVCEDNPWTLSWLACPVLEGVDSLVGTLDDFVQKQLNFSTGQNLNDSVHELWVSIRDISSIFLIMIMLVMVIAQALGGLGGLDAYTVRKILPKIIIAVILAQISWPVLRWVIGVANDAGQGIADIMFFPFHGSSQMTLQNLIDNLGFAAPNIVVSSSLFAIILISVLNPFGVLIFALAVIMAVFTAVATLMVRTALIIGCVAFFPIFITAWILPGTKKYWDMWRTNFSKALIMFPLIMAMIALGRIFAWISGTHGGETGAFDYIAVVVGYFGPYFFIPKAFKWGGTLLTQANGAISGAANKISEGPKKILQERQKELDHQKQISAARRVRDWNAGRLSGGQKFMSAVRGDKLRSGEWDPTYRLPVNRGEMHRLREEKLFKFRSQAIKSENEEREMAMQSLSEQATLKMPGQEDDYFQDVVNNADKHSDTEVEAALDLLADRGGNYNIRFLQRHLEDEFSAGGDRRVAAAKFANRKAGQLFGKIPGNDYYKGPVGWAKGAKASEFATVAESHVERVIQRLQADGSVEAQNALNNIYSEFDRAMGDSNLARNISPDMQRIINSSRGRATTPVAPTAGAAGAGVVTGGGTATAAVTTDPTQIRIQHRANYSVTLPQATAVATAGVQRDAYKARIMSDANTAQTLAHSLAYNVDAANRPIHNAVLQELRGESAGTPDRAAAFNGVIDRIQQSFSQRIVDVTEHARANPPAGTTPDQAAAQASQAEQARVAAEMQYYESMRIR